MFINPVDIPYDALNALVAEHVKSINHEVTPAVIAREKAKILSKRKVITFFPEQCLFDIKCIDLFEIKPEQVQF